MRLIDADFLRNLVNARLEEDWEFLPKKFLFGVRDLLDSTPTIDAVEVVRCQHCKHRFNGEHHDNCCDVLMEKVKWTFEVTVEPDWFCADGELGEGKTDG